MEAFKLSTILCGIGLALGGFVMYTIFFTLVYYVNEYLINYLVG